MLSPGSWHKDVPRDLKANLQFRLANLKAIGHDKNFQRGCMEVCRQDILFWINSFVCQYNPNSIGQGSIEIGPFITWDFQDWALIAQDPDEPGLLWCIDNKKDILILKSREMGASWLCLLVILWLFLFHPWKKILVISRSASAVDEPGDSDSLFWKLDFILEHLPDWMVGRSANNSLIRRRKFSFVHEGTRSAITGQASTGAAGVGGRGQLTFLDEFPMVKEDFEMLTKTASTSGSRIFNGTHNGTDTAFYKLADPMSVTGSFIKRLRMHWSQHPDKVKGAYRWDADKQKIEVVDKDYRYLPDFNYVMDGSPLGGPFPGLRSPWYDEQVKKIGSTRGAAEELDINAEGSMSQVFDAFTINYLIGTYCRPPYWEGELHYDPDTAKPIALVPVQGGRIKLWCHLFDGKPAPGRYGAGADCATGSGATPSCLSVISAETGEKVLGYANPHIAPSEFGVLCVAVCKLFEDARFCWEMQGPGETVAREIMRLGYRNIYFRTRENDLNKSVSLSPGWYPTNKAVQIRAYMVALSSRKCCNRDETAMRETLRFRYGPKGVIEHANEDSDDDPSGARVNHGDRVVADFLAWKMVLELGLKGDQEKKAEGPPVLSLEWRRALRQNSRREEAWA